jgi:UDP-glucose 4-epimerase
MILVTGGAGYIGSHVVRKLQQSGRSVLVLDNLSRGHRDVVEKVLKVPLVIGNVGDRTLMDNLLSGQHPITNASPIDAVMHFAAYAYVGESVENPSRYYQNNLIESLSLLQALKAEGIRRDEAPPPLIFSSTCATYGCPRIDSLPINETCEQKPINAYGRSKFMLEQILADFGAAHNMQSVTFRYFNAAGADPKGDIGERHNPETHLIPLLLESALNNAESVRIFGDDYDTPDGTCIRDYVHVCDIATAHVQGLEMILSRGGQHTYNLGLGHGFSVKQVIDVVSDVTGRQICTQVAPKRPGDPPVLVADATKAKRELGWKPKYKDLETIVKHAWSWHQNALKSTRSDL